MQLFFHEADLPTASKLGDRRIQWLQEIGAAELTSVNRNEPGFLFGYDRGESHFCDLIGDRPFVQDRPESLGELLLFDRVLGRLQRESITICSPQTWVAKVDEPLPDDLAYPVFVRTAQSSWKRGGNQSRANNETELVEEMELLRRTFGWDATTLIRKWLDIAVAGKWKYGDVPREIRVWIVDSKPVAWSFHYLGVVAEPMGFPPNLPDRQMIRREATKIASPFSARLMVVDFVQTKHEGWYFLEAGPGAVAGTAHEGVFKFVAKSLRGDTAICPSDAVGGPL
jgi:hypothetical protein